MTRPDPASRFALRFGSLVLFGLALCLPTASQAASKINLKTGDPLQGEIQKVTATEITYKRGIAEPETIAVNTVTDIEWEGEPPTTGLGRTAEANGQLDRALEQYQDALGKTSDENIKADIEFLVARTLAKLGKTNPEQLDQAVAKLNAYTGDHKTFYRYYDSLKWLGRSQMAKQDYDAAGQAFNQLATSSFQDYKMEAQVAQAKLQLRQDNVDAALAQFQQVASMKAEGELQEIQVLEAKLGQAECLSRKDDHAGALGVLDEVNKAADSTQTGIHGGAYLQKGDAYLAQGEEKEALMAYLHVDVLFDQDPDKHAKALFQLASLWQKTGKPEKGADARRRLKELYPQSEWAAKLGS